MVKKIKIVNKGTSSLENEVLRDTTVGNEYLVTFTAQGTACPDGIIAEQDSLSFKDDVDDRVSIFVADETYEVVACHEESVDGRFYKNNKVEAKIGDLVKCGLSTAVVCSISEKDEPNAVVKNCAVEGKLHLNCVSEAELVENFTVQTKRRADE